MTSIHLRLTLMLSVFCLLAPRLTAASLEPMDRLAFFIQPNEPGTLSWKAPQSEVGDLIPYEIRDTWQQSLKSGTATVSSEHRLAIPINVPSGYYDIAFPTTNQAFGVVSLPPFSGTDDAFFAIDSALSWLVADTTTREDLITILARSGIRMSRERFSWGQIHPQPEQWEWESSAQYGTLRSEYAKHAIAVLEMCHDTPQSLGRVGKYPANLIDAERHWRLIATRWRPTWGALEIWNEPDIFFGANLPADQYVAVVKTVVHALRDTHPDLPLVGGVMAHFNRPFLDNAAANGMLNDVDVLSFHTYGRALEMESLVSSYRDWLRQHTQQGLPLWLTECGRPWPKGTDQAPADSDRVSALDITMKAVEARCCGVQRYFAFVYPFYEENDNNFGMMGRSATPLRSMAAYAYLQSVLAGKQYVGDLKHSDPQLRRARVFLDSHEAIAVLYTGEPREDATVVVPAIVERARGIDGRELSVADGKAIPAPDGLTYVWLQREAVAAHTQTDTPAMDLWRAAQAPVGPRSDPASIIMRCEIRPHDIKPDSEGYVVPAPIAQRFPLEVRVFNLAQQSETLTMEVTCDSPQAINLAGADRPQISVPAQGAASSQWTLDLRQAAQQDSPLRLKVIARDPTGRDVSHLVIDLRVAKE